MAKKGLLLGMLALALALVFGMAVVGCAEEDDPCCTASTWKPVADADSQTELASAIKDLPTCCQTAYTKVMALAGKSATTADIKAAAGCCYDAMKEAFPEDF